jgi:4-aminobutyrate--pyruvate transaminase
VIIERNLKKPALILRMIGNRIARSPPVIIAESEVDELLLRLGKALDDTLAEIETG